MMYYPCSENKGADQLRSNREVDCNCAFVFAYADCWFSHAAALILFCLKSTPRHIRVSINYRHIPVHFNKRIGNRVYSAAHVSSLTVPRSLSVVLLQTYTADFK